MLHHGTGEFVCVCVTEFAVTQGGRCFCHVAVFWTSKVQRASKNGEDVDRFSRQSAQGHKRLHFKCQAHGRWPCLASLAISNQSLILDFPHAGACCFRVMWTTLHAPSPPLPPLRPPPTPPRGFAVGSTLPQGPPCVSSCRKEPPG